MHPERIAPLHPRRHALCVGTCLVFGVLLLPLSGQTSLPPGPGSDLAYAKCQPCHDMGVVIQSAGITRAMWLGVMDEMKEFGMQVTPDERKVLVDYFATYLGPDLPPVPENRQAPPAGSSVDGAQLFDRHCSACHGKDGKGASDQMPPLADNPYLYGDRAYTIAVILYGLQGPITIKDQTFEGVMPDFAHLDDSEIAAIAHYTLTAWRDHSGSASETQLPTAQLARTTRAQALTAKQISGRRRRSK